jgi:hypothetical protein
MANTGGLIQGLILFSTVLGVLFLWQVYTLLPSFVFDAIAFGWVLWVVDSVLTFVRPNVSYYLAVLLAFLTLAATLSQPEHYSLVGSGNLEAAATLIAGSSAQVAIILAVSYRLFARRSGGPT